MQRVAARQEPARVRMSAMLVHGQGRGPPCRRCLHRPRHRPPARILHCPPAGRLSGLPSAGSTAVHRVCCLEPSLCSSACKYWVLHEKLQNKHRISRYYYIYFFICTVSVEKITFLHYKLASVSSPCQNFPSSSY